MLANSKLLRQGEAPRIVVMLESVTFSISPKVREVRFCRIEGLTSMGNPSNQTSLSVGDASPPNKVSWFPKKGILQV